MPADGQSSEAVRPAWGALACDPCEILSEVLARAGLRHLPGARDRHREDLRRAIELGEQALAAGSLSADASAGLRGRLVEAYAVQAEDARYGAGQLSRGSQRAPTCEDCEDGWQRVLQMVQACQAAAARALCLADELGQRRAQRTSARAQRAADAARSIVADRNHAYTFHADPGFSFGEGWYLAAAGVLSEVLIQVEPDQAQSAQAHAFLSAAGLGPQLVPYRPRPRANKALPDLIARAFRLDPQRAGARLRSAFLGHEPLPETIVAFAGRALATVPGRAKVLLWLRYGSHQAERNTTYPELVELCRRAEQAGLVPVLIGDALRGGVLPSGAADLTLFWKDPLFQGLHMRRSQLQLFECLRLEHGLVGQLGVTTAGMDGPALMGLPTMYLTQQPNVRLGRWVGAVPGYEEIVRTDGYLERIALRLGQWARSH